MARNFTQSFSGADAVGQAVSTDPGQRIFGNLLKVGGIAFAGLAVASGVGLVGAVAAAGIYGFGAAIEANATRKPGYAGRVAKSLISFKS